MMMHIGVCIRAGSWNRVLMHRAVIADMRINRRVMAHMPARPVAGKRRMGKRHHGLGQNPERDEQELRYGAKLHDVPDIKRTGNMQS